MPLYVKEERIGSAEPGGEQETIYLTPSHPSISLLWFLLGSASVTRMASACITPSLGRLFPGKSCVTLPGLWTATAE